MRFAAQKRILRDFLMSCALPIFSLRNLLISLLAGCAAIHLSLLLRISGSNLLGSAIVSWVAIASLLGQRHHPLTSSPIASAIGTLLLIPLLIKSAHLTQAETFLDYLPLVAAIGVGLLASGWRSFQCYWRELLILAVPAILPSLTTRLINLAPLTAKLSTFLLVITGFPVVNQGVYIQHQGYSVEVNDGCSGMSVILQLWHLVLIYLLLFPNRRRYWVGLPIVATIIAFTINATRVSLLAILNAPATKAAFNYWHDGEGSVIFSMVAVLVLGGVVYFGVPMVGDGEVGSRR
jgi:cyanoexosortase A